ncbi:hypothetical protein BU26DRAFT_570624 [Trematosphaeria pertusa]|uniref:Uncharacterized protein n=1 Tax=Trematosphaeria pertusa TaxID=390896 RepID=A0A6A6HXT0_9PLEO|nr:uncharacterized protein BU26DRAFT_570624 [Trematosphaeria pertusa]KAF2242542.1 hypothetical protein BU26DRAFT_570624 [Trematosphaeria pertusa]
MRQIVGNPTNSDVKKSALPNIEEHWKQEWELWYLMTSGAGYYGHIEDHWKQECELWYLMTSGGGYYGREVKLVLDWASEKAGRP